MAWKLLLPLSLLWLPLAIAKCYEPTIAHHLPDYDPDHPLLKAAFAHISALLTINVAAPDYASSSFSVEITSSKQTLWSMHHTARERNSSRPDMPHVNGDALYRIASITKTFTVLGLLQQHAAGNLSLEDPVDKHLEALKGKQNGSIPWNDITLRSLASQLSGIPREFAQSDLVNRPVEMPFPPEKLGLPPVSREGLLTCDEYSRNYERPCDAKALLTTIMARDPLFAPNQKSSYSNVAFELLGLVLAKVSGQSYEDYITEAIFKPLGMTKSTLSRPPDKAGVIPLDPQYWDVDEGVQNPTGGIYSSTTDLSKYLRYVLTHYNAITRSVNWVQPVSPAEGLHTFYGMPWEIFHTDRALSNSQRTVRFITKGGGLPGYTSMIYTLPEYDLGITILLAGPPAFFSNMQEIVTIQMVRAAEQLAIYQLQQRYSGTFISTDPSLNSSVTISADHRGLILDKFISNSTDVINALHTLYGGGPKYNVFYVQLLPTLLNRDEEAKDGERWRLLFISERSKGERDVWDDECVTDMDPAMYAGLPLLELVFWRNGGRIFNDIVLTGFRANLTRIIKDSDVAGDEQQEGMEL